MASSKRSYGDVCGVARALDLVGERWTLMVVRELLLGPKRFTDLRAGLPVVGPDVLTQRLRDLTAAGLVSRRKLPPPAPAQVYELTDLGKGLEPVVMALGDFGSRLPVPTTGELRMSFDSHILSLRTLFDSEAAGDLDARVQLHLDGGPPFRAQVSGGAFIVDPGEHSEPDAIVAGDPGAMIGVAHGRLGLDDALAAGLIRLSGDAATAARFLTLFPLPEPATV